MKQHFAIALLALAASLLGNATAFAASEDEKPVDRKYVTAPPSPERQSAEEADAKRTGSLS